MTTTTITSLFLYFFKRWRSRLDPGLPQNVFMLSIDFEFYLWELKLKIGQRLRQLQQNLPLVLQVN